MDYETWYDANKESLTQLSYEAKLKSVFQAGTICGYKEADQAVPLVINWALVTDKEWPVTMASHNNGYVAGAGELFIQGPTAIGCMVHLASELLKTDEAPKLIVPGE